MAANDAVRGTSTLITPATAAVFIPEIWSAGVLEAAEFAERISGRVSREYEGDVSKFGDTVFVPRISNLSTGDKVSGTPISFESIEETHQTITIGTHQYAAFFIEDIVQVQAMPSMKNSYEKKLGYALTRGREIALAALFASFASPAIGSLGSELGSEDFLGAWTRMAEAGLLESSPDPSGEFTAMLSPAAYAAAMKVDVFVNSLYNKQADAINSISLGQIYGFPVFISNLLGASGGGHLSAIFHRSAMTLCVQKTVNVESQYFLKDLAWGTVSWNLYGAAVLAYPGEAPGNGAASSTTGLAAASANRGVLLNSV